MIRFNLIIVLTFLVVSLNARDNNFKKPDYNNIKKIIQDSESEYFYPTLYDRYIKSDTTLTLQDYRILYFGYLFNENYSAYGRSNYLDSLNVIYKQDKLTYQDYSEIIRFEKKVLEEYPFNLRNLFTLANAYYQIGDTLSTIQTNYKLRMIVETILSTGNGNKEKTAWHVISVGHEYDILGYFGFQFAGSQSLTKKGCDYLEVVPNEHKIKGFYFDVNMILKKQSELFK
jgi:hypothetical protein